MRYVQRELDCINEVLRHASCEERRGELYAAQQALAWVLEPDVFRRPYSTAMGTPASSEDYLARHHPLPSSNTYCQND